MIDNSSFSPNKALATDKVQVQNLKKVATVSVCLCDCDKCTASYIDATRTYIVKCICQCHTTATNLNDKQVGREGKANPESQPTSNQMQPQSRLQEGNHNGN